MAKASVKSQPSAVEYVTKTLTLTKGGTKEWTFRKDLYDFAKSNQKEKGFSSWTFDMLPINNLDMPLVWFFGWRELSPQDVMDCGNMELIAQIIAWVGLEYFIAAGGGSMILESTGKDYPRASMFTMKIGEKDHYFLKLLNSTIYEEHLKMNATERLNAGVDIETGARIYVCETLSADHWIKVFNENKHKKRWKERNYYGPLLDAVGHTFRHPPGVYDIEVET